MIEGIQIKKLKKYNDSRGYLMEILRQDDKIFSKFGQIYIAKNKPGWRSREWHYHRWQDDFLTCVQGEAELFCYDARKKSKTFGKKQKFSLSARKPCLVRVPRGVYHIYRTIGKSFSLIINIPTRAYNKEKPDEQRKPLDEKMIL